MSQIPRLFRRVSAFAVIAACATGAVAASAQATSTNSRSTRVAQHNAGSAAARSATVTVNPNVGTTGPCSGKTGVTVFVDLTAFSQGTQTRCASGTPATGVDALQQAGFTVTGTAQYGLAFVCRIDGYPTAANQSCNSTPPANAYWGYYHANYGATAWTYATTGASSYKPAQGSIEGWAFGDSATPSKTPAQVRAG